MTLFHQIKQPSAKRTFRVERKSFFGALKNTREVFLSDPIMVCVEDSSNKKMRKLEEKTAQFMRELEQQGTMQEKISVESFRTETLMDAETRDICDSVSKNLKVLIERYDMTVNEVKLTLAIDHRTKNKVVASKPTSSVTREMVASAYLDVIAGTIPRNKIALKILAHDIDDWLTLDRAPSNSFPYENKKTTWNLEKNSLKIETDKQRHARLNETSNEKWYTLPTWLGFGALYIISATPILIALCTVGILFASSLT